MDPIDHHACPFPHREIQDWLPRACALLGALVAIVSVLLLTARSADVEISVFLDDPMMWAILSIAAVPGLCAGGLAGLCIQRLLVG